MSKTLQQTNRPPRPRKAETAVGDGDDAVRLQHQLLDAQAAIERDYVRLRELETRYRYLIQSSSDAIVIVAGDGLRILDANAAAATCFGATAEALVGAGLASFVDARGSAAVEGALRGEEERFALHLPGRAPIEAVPTVFRQDGAPVVMLRLECGKSERRATADNTSSAEPRFARYARSASDAIVLTDRAGAVLQANEAFVELVQLATERQLRGASLGRWLGRTSVDLGVLISNLRQRRTLKLFATQLRAEHGAMAEVEISAALVGDGEDAFLGFTIRDVGRRLPSASDARRDIAKSVEQMTELVGRVPMKDIVSNTAGLIEQMCIKAALELTRDNRAAAAELLGLSRQSFYVKLRRYKMLEVDGA